MEQKPTTLMIADDHKLFAEGLSAILSEQPNFKVIGTASNGKEILHLLNHQIPDILILDLNMPVLDGEIAAEKIRQLFPSVKIMVLSMYYTVKLAAKLESIGVKAFVQKDTDAETLFTIISDLQLGEKYFQKTKPDVQPSVFNDGDHFQKSHNLTTREMEILQLISEDYSSQQIAQKLFIALNTVDTHRKNMAQKLNVSGKAGLLKFAIENKLR
ncbi:response regulator transcription factor [Pedobacter riviphilus]|uniref:Response regulator transcription factor n=1 Tax=Pedobacter riviphilus TaxID=2766984 RepID=A0ABX6TGU6_9SPHI|nr:MULTISPECIES: response regulator transcription factor [Pedobacter]NII84355.1 DNA-binding NarL/FixJ family response regulator [Pedobacter sp. SG908]NMN38730.1 DNA-binding NarL/FixJ family response regulator [Pedobacter sp. SG918]QNR84178.1 response regulator transcription factor [Pedobacter riviphilus]